MHYVAGLDGLRALAILLVLFFHSKVPGLPGGNVGVDLFLVLSGFLITSLLLDEQDRSGTIGLKRFYLRRAWRLTPALLLMLFLYSLFAPLLWPEYFFHLRDVLAVLLYVANLAAAAGYAPEKLLHGWSLGLEEQFYLVWPLVLLAVFRLLSRSTLWLALLGLYVLLCAWRIWCLYGMGAPGGLAYYRPDLHAGGLVLGAALAAWWRQQKEVGGNAWMAKLGWLSLAVALISPQSDELHLALFVPLAEIGTALLIVSILLGKQALFAGRLVTHIGKLSYGLYLFHYPIMLYLVQCRLHWAVVFCIGGVLSYALAWVSFNTVEAAARRYRERLWPSPQPAALELR
ncbi:acyltransferase family protein [Pseudomonas sp. Gutcm_11s]|uniref:acyltransferase family protein n=1 Tax=Pseudomonas sp. Gutcm_11s TaxID=3026088 RepID=UPI0023621B35|nr:acyltransferase [Pseudomonas sp. Gutcm_11s]MDD0844554.1 acyltransferase [Pseudomonas sp. Gutcm_11s]